MTAAEAREAAAVVRALADHGYASGSGICVSFADLPPSIDDIDETIQNAAVALDAYADGLDAAAAPEFRPTSADTNRLHRIRARLLDLVPLDGTMSLADDVQRLDRALENAEARGRQHGLLAAAMLPVRPWWDHGLSFCGDCGAENASVAEFVDEIVALASEASDGR